MTNLVKKWELFENLFKYSKAKLYSHQINFLKCKLRVGASRGSLQQKMECMYNLLEMQLKLAETKLHNAKLTVIQPKRDENNHFRALEK